MNTARRSRCAPGTLAVLATLVGGTPADAQDYPTRPITVIIPFAGGSASDVVTRILLDRAGKSLGQPFVVDNRPGAGGNVGTLAAAKSRTRRLHHRRHRLRAGGRQPDALSRSRLRPGKGFRADRDDRHVPDRHRGEHAAAGEDARGDDRPMPRSARASSTTARSASAARSTSPALISSSSSASSSPTCPIATSRSTRRT